MYCNQLTNEMDLEKLFNYVMSNPTNISITYSNIDGKEKLIVNGKDLSNETYDDSEIKAKVAAYKENIDNLSDEIFERVLEKAEQENFNLVEMNKGLELESFSEEDAIYANNVISLMSELIVETINEKMEALNDMLLKFV